MSKPPSETTIPLGNVDDWDDSVPEHIPPILLAVSVLYGLLLIVGASWVWINGYSLIEPTGAWEMIQEVSTAVVIALIMLCVVGAAWKYTAIFRHVEGAFAERLADLSGGGVLILALFSAVSEEILFRGAFQTYMIGILGQAGGLIGTSLVFGLMHTGPSRLYLGWTAFAALSGFALGAAFILTGNIIVPIVIHLIINAINMWLIITRRRWHGYQSALIKGA